MDKINLLVLFGGQSSEHDVSCKSVQNVVKNINDSKYNVLLVGITKEGHWVSVDSLDQVADGSWRDSAVSAILSPDATKQCLYLLSEQGVEEVHIDVIFPVLHGLYGEDGTIQGIFELARIPYVGCGVLSSAASMDKVFTKLVVEKLGIRQADYVAVHRDDLSEMDEVVASIEAKLPYPVFVKPSCAGSSVGVSKAADRDALKQALLLAAEHDSKILVEENIVGRELECAVLGGGKNTKASGVGEVLAAADFYDFDAKYNNPESKTTTSPVLPEGVEEEIRTAAVRIFRGLGGHSLSRVDFFLDKKGIVFNEINTLPGFTAISMYPMLWDAKGISKPELVEAVIQTAYDRHEH